MDFTKQLYSEAGEPLCEVAKWDDEYQAAKPKVLFILKEPSTRNDDPDYNFKAGLEANDWKRLRMWKPLAYCSEGLQAIGRGEDPRFKRKGYGKCKQELKSSSYMNLKRFGAGRKSDMALVGLHAGLFWPLTLSEIREIEPQIIVCCGTYSILRELLVCLKKLPAYSKALGFPACGTFTEQDNSGRVAMWNWEAAGQRMAVINMAHPGKWGTRHKTYFDELMKAAREVWSEMQSGHS